MDKTKKDKQRFIKEIKLPQISVTQKAAWSATAAAAAAAAAVAEINVARSVAKQSGK